MSLRVPCQYGRKFAMQLTAYLEKTKTDRKDFAALLGVDPITVYRWENGTRFPRGHLNAISKATNGKVTALDFVKEDA
jgi:DNA-binding transcriptional regulator YdaS (Cro superfamily)